MWQVEYPKEPGRLDKVLTNLLAGLSRSTIQKKIKAGQVLVDGKVEKANFSLVGTEKIEINMEETVSSFDTKITPEAIELEIVYEDEDLLVINKPRGMVMHPSKGHSTGTLVNALMYYFDQNLSQTESHRPGIIHRLDKDTAGLVIVAKNNQVHEQIAQQIQSRQVERTYQAFVHGDVSTSYGRIEMPLRRSKANRLRYEPHVDGKYALTEFEVLQHHSDWSQVKLNLITGRTHQLRVHLEAIGHPIIGDPIYRRGIESHSSKLTEIQSGQWLTANRLSFIHPTTQQRLTFELEIDLPDELQELI